MWKIVSIFLITVAFLIAVALIAGMVGHVACYPIEIRDWYDLNAIRDNMGGNYTLMNDLDSTTPGYEELASPTANGGKGWQPIGTIGEWGDRLTGTLDGQGYEIRDLFINRPDEYYVGLFGAVGQEGVVKNIGLVNVTVNGFKSVGGLVGFNDFSTVSNSHSSGNVIGDWNVGGLVGQNTGAVSNSYATGSVTGNNRVGGLVGFNHFGTVNNSYSTSSVTGSNWTGGLVGENRGTVSNSFWDIETSGQVTSDGGTGKTTAEMQDIVTFSGAGWDIIAVANPGTRNLSHTWNIVDDQTYPFLSWHLGCPQGHISPTQMETETIPLGYFELTVSPAEVCANIGEQIEIRCTIEALINCVIEISSVDVLLFDSYDSMIREQAMTKDSYWSANTVYTIVGDEAYYQLKVNFTFPLGEPGEYSEYGAHSFPIVVKT